MFFELFLFTAWLIGSILVTVSAFFVGRLISRKIKKFFDNLRR